MLLHVSLPAAAAKAYCMHGSTGGCLCWLMIVMAMSRTYSTITQQIKLVG